MEQSLHGETSGWLGLILTAVSIAGTCLTFLVDHYTFITVPFTITAAVYAIKYYRAAKKYYDTKNNDNGKP